MGGAVKQYVGLSGDKAEALVTVAGAGDNGMADGPGDVAIFHGVKSVAWHAASETLLASDFFNYRIRALSPPKQQTVQQLPVAGRLAATRAGAAGASATIQQRQMQLPQRDDDHAGYERRAAAGKSIRVMVWTGHSGPYHDHFSNGKILADALNRSAKRLSRLAVYSVSHCLELCSGLFWGN